MTTWPPRLSTAAITRSDPMAFARADRAGAKERRADDHRVRSNGKNVLCAFDRSDAPANAAGKSGTNGRDDGRVVALPFGRVEIDELHPRKSREARNPRLRVGFLDGEFLTLHELHDASAL
jgi:hypothetical protein